MDWTDPDVEEVADGVHRIPLPLPMDGLRAVNVYAIVGPTGVTLIDGGWRIDSAQAALDVALAGLRLSAADVGRCLVTHHHRDHYTLAVGLRRRTGMPVALGAGEKANLDVIQSADSGLQQQRVQLEGAGARHVAEQLGRVVLSDEARADYEDPDEWLDDGDEIRLEDRQLRVRTTPGHTLGHVVFMDDRAGLIFAGDHILPHITPSIGFQAAPAQLPLADYLASLALVLAEPDRVLLPAHGPAGGSTHARIHELLAHHDTRLDQTRAAVAAGAGTPFEAAQALGWTRRRRTLAELDLFNQMLAILETQAHLDVLVAQGRVYRRTESGLRTYQTSPPGAGAALSPG